MPARITRLGWTAAATASSVSALAATTSTAQVGLVLARGNANTQTANAQFELVHETTAVKDDFEIEGLYGSSSGIVTAERWATRFQRNWNITTHTFWFGNFHYEDDAFSGFAYQGSAATGIGYNFVDTDATKLSMQLGAGYRRLRPEQLVKDARGEVIERIPGTVTEDAVGNAQLDYRHSLSETTQVIESFVAIAGSTNTRLQNDLSLRVKMTTVLSLSVAYTVRYNSSPPPGLLRTDQQTTINLVYTHKN
jgi:putative salt-induced outer membrane protein